MEKLKIRIISMQLFGMIFLINGIFQLKIYAVAEKYACAIQYFQNQKSECWGRLFPNKEDFSQFLSNVLLWKFLGLLIVVVFISFLNWKNKISFINTILASILIYTLLWSKFFKEGITTRLFISFGNAFSNDFEIQYLIGGITFTVIGATILWLSVNKNLFKFNRN